MSTRQSRPIFFDPERRRWPLVLGAFVVLGGALGVLTLVLIACVALDPVLPRLGITPGATKPSAAKRRALPPIAAPSSASPAPSESSAAAPRRADAAAVASQQSLTFAFYVNWDGSGLSSLKSNGAAIDVLVPEWLHLARADGVIEEDDPELTARALEVLRASAPATRVMPLLNNFGASGLETAAAAAALADPAARASTQRQIRAFLDRVPTAAGACIDISGLPADSSDAYCAFLGELAQALHGDGMSLAVVAPAADRAFAYARVAALADFVIVPVYDQHGSGGTAGPLASLSWSVEVIAARSADIPAGKLVVALGSYAYDWPTAGAAESIGFDQAMQRARAGGATVAMDAAASNPTFSYSAEDHERRTVWFLDGVTVFNQARAARAAGARHLALWRMGTEDPSVWQVLGAHRQPTEDGVVAALREISFAYRLDYQGRGEVVSVASAPSPGARELHRAADGRIDDERYAQLPVPYVVQRFGSAERVVALTFDDGPDPQWTGRVLDALAAKQAPATFFVIGKQCQSYPELVRREYELGHEVGNHTFSHPVSSRISLPQLRWEVTGTARLLESVLGHRSLLFRPPYLEAAEARSADEAERLKLVTDLGYLIVGSGADTDDWRRPGVDHIVTEGLRALERGDGQILLMHDGGGDRSQTVAALPRLIDGLRARGYRLVTVSELLGRTRAESMPALTGGALAVATVNRGALAVCNCTTTLFRWAVLTSIGLGLLRLGFICTMALRERLRRRAIPDPRRWPRVAVVIPAYNEEKVIVQTVASILAADYPLPFEVVVVDDGSRDATFERVREAYAGEPRVRAYRKENGGKPEALTFGIARTDAEVIVALDADTVFPADTIRKLARHFDDPRIAAVAGNAKVGNRVNAITKWQALEYVTSQNLDRRAFHALNCITVVPGAVGAWRREVVERLGGFTGDTLAEDADLTIAILRQGYRIVYDDEAVALTEAPDTIRGFVRQRYRWMFGTVQAAWKHRGCMLRPSAGALGMVAMPNILLFQVLFPLIAPAVDACMLISLVSALLSAWQHDGMASMQPLRDMLVYYAVFIGVDYAAALVAYANESTEDWRLLWWLFWQRFMYRQLLYYVAIKSTLSALRGGEVGWGRIARKGSVRIAIAGRGSVAVETPARGQPVTAALEPRVPESARLAAVVTSS